MKELIGFMEFAGGETVPRRCSNCDDIGVVQQSLDGGHFCQKCWKKWMGEPTSVVSIEEECGECGREGDTPKYLLRNGGHRTCCSACFVKEFGEMPIRAEEEMGHDGKVRVKAQILPRVMG